MGKLSQLIANATKGSSVIERNYSEALPASIAEECGPAEVEDLLAALDELSRAREEHDASDESWDGDASDDMWRAQKCYAGLLVLVASRFPLEVAKGLRSVHGHTRFWVAYTFEKKPSKRVVSVLAEAALMERGEPNKSMVRDALRRCRLKAWLPFL